LINSKPFLEALDERVLVCDGAMGTMLYAKGVFINRCFDSLNVMSSDTVTEIHQDYVRAGADVLETNTFGANRIKLRSFGLGDRVHDINVEGARLARKAARDQVYVAGAIGPLGVRIEPWGKMGTDEAESYFREQAEALAEGGVDLFVTQLAHLCTAHRTRAKWVFVPTHAIGHTRMATESDVDISGATYRETNSANSRLRSAGYSRCPIVL